MFLRDIYVCMVSQIFYENYYLYFPQNWAEGMVVQRAYKEYMVI